MSKTANRMVSLLLALVMALGCVTFVAADTEAFAYTGDAVNFIKVDGAGMGMMAPQEGTTCVINGDNVVIHYVPKKDTYGAIHWGAITDTLTADVTMADGAFDITLPKTSCGKALPVAPIKASDATATTKDQYYLAIPAADKLTDVTSLAPLTYEGATVNFIKEDGSGFGMFTPQEGTTCVINGDNVVIHYVPKNTTVYNALHWGAITDTLTADVAFATDGTFDITLPKTSCGKALPVAPIKASDATATTKDQYYLAIPAADKLTDVTPLAPLTYTGDAVNFIKEDGSGFGMFAPQEGTTCVINGDNVVIHYVPKNKTTYNALHWGAITDTLTKDVTFAADGTFDITLPKTSCGKALPVAPIKASDATATTSTQYYLAIPAADKLTDMTPEPSAPAVNLTITNNTKMFKGDAARLEEGALVVSLTGTTYHYLIPGTYDQAVALGDNHETWIEKTVNAAGKYEFRLPLTEGQTYVPVVSVSNTYYTKYLNGENPLARAFFPRQFVIDYEAKTLTVDDYAFTQTLSVTNNVKMFKVSAAALNTVGGPNSNNYAATLALTMGSTSFDKAFVGRVSAITDTTETIALGENNTFVLPVKWVVTMGDPTSVQSLLGGSFVVSFHSASKDAWYERQFTVSEANGTLTIDEAPPEAVTVEPGTQTLEKGVCYRFGEGTFTLSGDPTVYRGGQEFYVSATGTYTVTKGR